MPIPGEMKLSWIFKRLLLGCLTATLTLASEPAIAGKRSVPPPANDAERLARLCAEVAAAFDSARGGFVSRNGTPSESAVELGLGLGRTADGAEWRSRALATMNWTAGLMDTIGGGFAERRAASGADGEAFSMRTDVNARRLDNLITAWKTTGNERWRRDAVRVVGFFDRILLDGRGGFVAAQVGDRTLVPAANGFAIRAWLRWAAANRDPRFRDFALKSIDRVWETDFDPIGVLLQRGDFGEVTKSPQLADQVEMGRALVLASQLCGRPQDLARARALALVMVAKFEDRQRGGFMTEATPKKDGTIRRAAREAGENGRAALFLRELSAVTGEPAWGDAASRTVAAFDQEHEKSGLEAADWAMAVNAALAPERPARPDWPTVASMEPPATPSVIRFKLPRKR